MASNLRRHEPLGLLYRWPPTAADASAASQAPHPTAELLRLLAVDSQGRSVWNSFDELAEDLTGDDVSLWAERSGANDHFAEPELDDWDREKNRQVMALRGQMGFGNNNEMRDQKAWESMDPFRQMVIQLSLAHSLDPHSLMKMDYAFIRGMLAKANLNAREQERRARNR